MILDNFQTNKIVSAWSKSFSSSDACQIFNAHKNEAISILQTQLSTQKSIENVPVCRHSNWRQSRGILHPQNMSSWLEWLFACWGEWQKNAKIKCTRVRLLWLLFSLATKTLERWSMKCVASRTNLLSTRSPLFSLSARLSVKTNKTCNQPRPRAQSEMCVCVCVERTARCV